MKGNERRRKIEYTIVMKSANKKTNEGKTEIEYVGSKEKWREMRVKVKTEGAVHTAHTTHSATWKRDTASDPH